MIALLLETSALCDPTRGVKSSGLSLTAVYQLDLNYLATDSIVIDDKRTFCPSAGSSSQTELICLKDFIDQNAPLILESSHLGTQMKHAVSRTPVDEGQAEH
jgi:hypothetical protein